MKPIVMLVPKITGEDIERFQSLSAVLFCEWPFNSRDFVEKISAANGYAINSRSSMKKLDQVYEYLKESQGNPARALIDEIQNDISEVLVSILFARSFLVEGDCQMALTHAEKACELAPECSEAWEVLARIKNKMGKRSEAIAALENHKAVVEKDADSLILLADLCLEDGQVKESKENYAKASSLDPRNAVAKKGKFLVGILDGSITKVQTNNATKTSLELAKVCNARAIALVRSEQFELAEDLYRNTIQLLPDRKIEYKLWMNLGLCMKKARCFEKAIEHFKMGKEKAPPNYPRFDEQIEAVEKLVPQSRTNKEK